VPAESVVMPKTTTRKQARRRARIDKRTNRDLQRAVARLLAEAITLPPRFAAITPPQNVADALLDDCTPDAVPSAQPAQAQPMLAEFERLDHALTARGWKFCGHCSDPDALTWHHLPSRHETISDLSYATTTITVINHTAATMSGSDVELIPAGCAWIDGYWSTTVATLLANLAQVEQHRAGDDPRTLPFYPCGPHTHASQSTNQPRALGRRDHEICARAIT
jgi:hypothetical protein